MDQYEDCGRRLALERELEELQSESAQGKQVLDSLAEKVQALRAEVERQRRTKPERGCASCHAVTLQVDAAAQSLLGSAGHVARSLLRDVGADRAELLETVLRYLEPVKHLDPDLEDLYASATASITRTGGAAHAARGGGAGGGFASRGVPGGSPTRAGGPSGGGAPYADEHGRRF
mmetsp:Transcript_66603/g.179332  ORF Transcript_66603/g.179332 Transcript_66603/m.179332 type:complete len:176 (-) Transcript_66603:59-586(-)